MLPFRCYQILGVLQIGIKSQVGKHVAKAIEEYEKTMANLDNTRSLGGYSENAGGTCPELVSTKKKNIEKYIRGLPEGVKGNVTSSKPATLHDAINMARELIEQGVQARELRTGESNKRKWEDQQGNNHHQQQNQRQEAAKAYVAASAEGRGYIGNIPWCNRCKAHHQSVIMESLVKKKQKGAILELKRRHLKNTIFCTYTPYPAMKIRRISASSAQETRNDQFPIRRIHYNQYAVCTAVKKKITMAGPITKEYISATSKSFILNNNNGKIIKKNFIKIEGTFLLKIHDNAFHGNDGEDVFKHINSFLEVVEPLKIKGLSHDPFRLSVFPTSLSGAAKEWFTNECIRTISTWDDLFENFVLKFYNLCEHDEEEEIVDDNEPNVIKNVPEIFKIDDDLFNFDSPLCIAFE
ncbi:hypothetical protein Tco_1023111 [Tanacetum coccineum]